MRSSSRARGRAGTGGRRITAGSSRSGANTRSCVNRTLSLSLPGRSFPPSRNSPTTSTNRSRSRRAHTDETDEQLDALVQAALGIMAGVLKPLGTALTRLPMGPANPGRTAGAAFQMYYQMGNFVPWRNAAWVLLSERAAVLSRQCAECATQDGVPEAVSSAATTAATISEQLAGHLPQDLRPAKDKLVTDPAS